MQRTPVFLAPLIALLVIAGTALADERVLLRFSAMGCGPYSPADEAALQRYVAMENGGAAESRSAFLVHLGDICSGAMARSGALDDAYYGKVASLLTEGSTIPAYAVPGDNEWNDRPDPEVGWESWSDNLLDLPERHRPSWATRRQGGRTENFAFVESGIVFIGINLVGGRIHDSEEWTRRVEDDIRWIAEQLDDARAGVIFCQANPDQAKAEEAEKQAHFARFIDGLRAAVPAFQHPVLLLHADGHKWIDEPGYKKIPNLRRVQVDRVEPNFPPVQVSVTEQDDGTVAFRFDRRLPAEQAPDGIAPRPESP